MAAWMFSYQALLLAGSVWGPAALAAPDCRPWLTNARSAPTTTSGSCSPSAGSSPSPLHPRQPVKHRRHPRPQGNDPAGIGFIGELKGPGEFGCACDLARLASGDHEAIPFVRW